MVIHEHYVKNGNGTMCYQYSYDASKPKVWVDGMSYQFNKSIIDRKYFPNMRTKDDRS